MSTATAPSRTRAAARARAAAAISLPVLLLIIAGALALTSLVRLITGADDITSVGQMSTALRARRPDRPRRPRRSVGRARGRRQHRPRGHDDPRHLVRRLGRIPVGPVGRRPVRHHRRRARRPAARVITVTFGVNHIVSGVAINILAVGVTRYLSTFAFDEASRAVPPSSPRRSTRSARSPCQGCPTGCTTSTRSTGSSSPTSPASLGGLVTDLSLLTVIALALIPVTWCVLWRTAFGLRLRSCGENPVAAESLGVNVYKYKYLAVIISGGLAGLGGAFLAIVAIEHLPGGPDRRPRLHRSRRDDLR